MVENTLLMFVFILYCFCVFSVFILTTISLLVTNPFRILTVAKKKIFFQWSYMSSYCYCLVCFFKQINLNSKTVLPILCIHVEETATFVSESHWSLLMLFLAGQVTCYPGHVTKHTHLYNKKYFLTSGTTIMIKWERYIECLAHKRHSVIIVVTILLNN